MGAPRKFTEEKDRQLKAILRLKPTLKDCAAFLDLDASTIERHIKKNYKCTYAEFREQNMVHTRFGLVRTAIKKAENGDNTMLIFCLKNLCGWKDRYEQETTHTDPVQIQIVKDGS